MNQSEDVTDVVKTTMHPVLQYLWAFVQQLSHHLVASIMTNIAQRIVVLHRFHATQTHET